MEARLSNDPIPPNAPTKIYPRLKMTLPILPKEYYAYTPRDFENFNIISVNKLPHACAICQEETVHWDYLTAVANLWCGHSFHLGCVQELVTHCKKECPLCKERLPNRIPYYLLDSTKGQWYGWHTMYAAQVQPNTFSCSFCRQEFTEDWQNPYSGACHPCHVSMR